MARQYTHDVGPIESQPTPEHRGSAPAVVSEAYGLYLDAWELIARDDIRGLAAICDPEFRFTVPGIADASLETMLQIARQWRQAFSNFGLDRDDMTVFYDGDDKIATRDRHTLRHTGPFITTTGETIPATGNLFTLFGAHFVRVRRSPQTRTNLIVRWDIIFDRQALMEELQRPRSRQDRSGVTMSTPAQP